MAAVRVIWIARELYGLGIPAPIAGRLAERLLDGEPSLSTSLDLVAIRADLGKLSKLVDQRLAEAAQTVVVRRRGRPPNRPL